MFIPAYEEIKETQEQKEQDVRNQANLDFYQDDSLRIRETIRNDSALLQCIDHWWTALILPLFDDDGDGNIQRNEYRGLYRVLLHALTKLFCLKKKKSGKLAEKALLMEEEEEWKRDSDGQDCIHLDRFRTVIFELVDIWCDSISSQAYVTLTNSIFETVRKIHPFKKKKSHKKIIAGAPNFSPKSDHFYSLCYKSFDIYGEVLKREAHRKELERKSKLTWGRGISRLKKNNAMRLLIGRLKNNGTGMENKGGVTEGVAQKLKVEPLKSGAVKVVMPLQKMKSFKWHENVEAAVEPSTPSTRSARGAALSIVVDDNYFSNATNRMQVWGNSATEAISTSTPVPKKRRRKGYAKKNNSVLKRPKSAFSGVQRQRSRQRLAGQFGRRSGTMSMQNLRRFTESKGRVGNETKVQTVNGLRKKKKSVFLYGDQICNRATMNFVEKFGGIDTELTAAVKDAKMK